MSNVKNTQRRFLTTLLMTLMLFHGKATFRNLSRYSDCDEKTYARGFRRPFDFVEFNQLAIAPLISNQKTLVAALDCSFIPKSGKQTYGLDKFYHSQHGLAETGIEISTLAIIDVDYNTAYHWSIRQTPTEIRNSDETRVDCYLEHLKQDRHALPTQVRHLVTDGYYSKTKFIEGVAQLELFQIGKLRQDASLRWRYLGVQKPRGRPKLYDGKVTLTDLSRFELAGPRNGFQLYTAIVNSPHFKHNLQVVYLVKPQSHGIHTAWLFSTDLQLSAFDIYRFYQARFQIEFLFREAKQFTGLCDCQSRKRDVLHFHFNVTMTALNFLKIEDRQRVPEPSPRQAISIASWKTRHANTHLLERVSNYLGLDFSLIKSRPDFQSLCNYGAIAT
ncbi:MAG: hypothetical protein BWK78_06660 [Thiotrichaceae bacterium IS1]|nr:MAG: hypothetical protein BWK78_06660 [Thiotrichaceae bacterium IS1]